MLFAQFTVQNKFYKLILLCIFFHAINPLSGQPTFNSDEEFKKARTLALAGKRAEARSILRKVLAVKPTYTEVQTLLGRTYSWDGKYDSARIELEQALSYESKNEDATNALIDVELWTDNYKTALDISNRALKDINPRSEDFLFKKARALVNLENYKDAYATLQELLKINPKNTNALSLSQTVKRDIRINTIGVNYEYDRFSTTFTPWQNISAFYSRKTKLLGSVIARINFAKRFEKPGTQYEIDMYPKITKNIYSYLNFGYSADDIFPNYRFGFSLFANLPKSFEAEIGMRYLKFSGSTIIYTGSISKYVSSFWFSLRPYFIPDTAGNAYSFAFISRYYLTDPDNYFTLSMGTGFVPDEFSSDVLIGTSNLRSHKASLGFQHRIISRFIIGASIGYRRDEYSKDLFRENFNFNTGLEIFF